MTEQSLSSDDMIYEMTAVATAVINDRQLYMHVTRERKQLEIIQTRQ